MPETRRKGFAVWLTGLPASGKSTIAAALAERLAASGADVQILDSDQMRAVLTPEPIYSDAERGNFYNAVGYIAALLCEHGVATLIAATANRRAHRDAARQRISRFMEVHVDCPIATCARRDPKGLYERAERGRVPGMPGIAEPYEPPPSPDLTVRTDREQPEQAAERIVTELRRRAWLSKETPR